MVGNPKTIEHGGALYAVISGDGELAMYSSDIADDVLDVPHGIRTEDGRRYRVTQFGHAFASKVNGSSDEDHRDSEPQSISGNVRTIILPSTVRRLERFSANGLQTFVMSDSVMTVSRNQFAGCPNLRDIVLSRNLVSLSEGMFRNCRGLEHIDVPERIETIPKAAFDHCEGLRHVSLPKGLEEISEGAFSECGSLESLYLPEGVRHIGAMAFSGCRVLRGLKLPDSLESIGDGALDRCLRLERLDIGDGLDEFPNNILHPAPRVSSVRIGSNVRRIRYHTFLNWRRLSNVELPESLERIDDYAFDGCESMVSICIPKDVSVIDRNAFHGCTSLVDIHVDSRNPYYRSHDGCLYTRDMRKLIICPEGKTGRLDVPEGVEYIGEDSFAHCTGLTYVSLPDSVKEIGMGAFEYCTSLSAIWFGNGIEEIRYRTFSGCLALDYLRVPDCVVSIEQEAFLNCRALKSVHLPDSVRELNNGAFGGCVSLEEVSIGDGLSFLAAYTFCGCSSLTDVDIDPDNGHFTVVDGIVYTKDMKELVFCPQGLDVGTFVLPATVEYVRAGSLFSCEGITRIEVEDGNGFYVSSEGVLYTKDMKEMVRHPYAKGDMVLESGLTQISADAFSGTDITSVIVPDGVMGIGHHSFHGCRYLTDVWLPGSIVFIDAYGFSSCVSLRAVTFNGFVESVSVEEGAFEHCPVGIDLLSGVDGWYFDAYSSVGTLLWPLPDNGLRSFDGVLMLEWYEIER